MTMRLADLATQRASRALVGRDQERATLLQLLEEGGPRVAWVYGTAGIGKSMLLAAFLAHARDAGATVVRLDGRAFEPTERGFLGALSAAIGGKATVAREAAERLGHLDPRVVLALDNCEVLRLLEAWMRQVFVPSLPDNVRIVLVSREPPVTGWQESPGWTDLFLRIRVMTLPDTDAEELLKRIDVPEGQRRSINRFARGHPLALRVAAAAVKERTTLDLEHIASEAVIEVLTTLYLRDLDPSSRMALDAAAVVRRSTLTLLGAMLPDRAPQDAFDRLRSLPFVELGPDGLILHDAIQQVVAATLRAADPARHRQYRQAAWRQLTSEVRTAGVSELWRYTADLLYLVENPVVREAFFPSTSTAYSVEPAQPRDVTEITEIIERHEPPSAAIALRAWWPKLPQSFRVVRDSTGALAGFYCMFEVHEAIPSWLDSDPLLRTWWKHLRAFPVPGHQRALFVPRWLARETGEMPSAVQAACWLDIKRAYMELRPNLRRVYTVVRDLATYAPVVTRLGFRQFPGSDVDVDGIAFHSAVLDFGPASVDGWLSGLVAAEIGVDERDLAMSERQLVLDGRRIDLSRLEFDVMQLLYQHEGRPVPRRSIMEAVWGHDIDTSSNVLEAVVKSLRKKMGERAAMIETVRGVGYRFRRHRAAPTN